MARREAPESTSDEAPFATRRALLAAGAGVATLGATVGLADTATAASSPTPRPYTATPKPTPFQRHVMNRLGCGFSPSTYSQLRHAGGADRWVAAQLHPSTVTEGTVAKALPSWFPDMNQSPATKWSRQSTGMKGGWEYAADLAAYTMLRRVYSHRTVLETMTDFWSNHLHVHADHDLAWVYRKSYDAMIRSHALGRFDDLLVAAALHPAMRLYLDNWTSVRGAPNENQGRELLELHTVGLASGYTEQMVKDSAKILSGYTVDAFHTWKPRYDASRHTTGSVRVLGFHSANASADGRAVTLAYLRYLAHHPATARNIAFKLARFFVTDNPSAAFVDHLATVFRESGTDIRATMQALVRHPQFRDPAHFGVRVRNPVEDVVATCRAMRVAAHKPTDSSSFAHAVVWLPQTTLLYQWPRPDGSPIDDRSWATPARMLSSFGMHWNMTAGWWPTKDVTYRKPASWLPQKRIRLDAYVDHLCRTILGRGSTSRILDAACTAVGYGPGTVVTADHAVSRWLFVRLVGVLLDSPEHMQR